MQIPINQRAERVIVDILVNKLAILRKITPFTNNSGSTIENKSDAAFVWHNLFSDDCLMDWMLRKYVRSK